MTPEDAALLTQTPPKSITHLLADEGVAENHRLLCTDTDIDRLGRYARQWLVATDQAVLIVSDGDQPQVVHHLRYEEAEEFRCHSAVGSGLLQARVDGAYVDLLRYSNRLADRFEKVARKLERRLHGEPIVVHPEEQADRRPEGPSDVKTAAVMTRMWRLMRPYRRSAAVMMLLLLIGIGLDLVSPQLTRVLVDRVLPRSADAAAQLQSQPSLLNENLKLLLSIVAILAGVQILRMGVNIANGCLGSIVGTAITSDMRSRLVDHLQKLAVSYYDRQQVGSLVGRVAYDTEALHGFVNQLTGGFLFQILMIVGVGIMMFSIDPLIACYALLPAPLVVTGSLIFWRYIYPRNYRTWDASSKQAGMLSGILSGIRVVKAFSQEHREQARFDRASHRLRNARRSMDVGVGVFNPIMGLVFQLGGWIVWYIGGRDVLLGHLTLGQLMAFFGYLWMFYGPLSTLTQFTNWLTQFITQANRIFEILDAPVQITEHPNAMPLPQVQGEIRFESVFFGYQPHNPIIRDMGFTVQAGQMIGVVGRSGSGKSTIVNLICRFYDVNEGRVLIDGKDVRVLRMSDLRSHIGVVLQEPFLFRGSIWDNLIYGRINSQVEQVIAASKSGNCHDFIMHKPHGYDTWVGERGAGLSGGERQRVSIARVLLTDPRILILDEATSSVDAESEAAIQRALARVVKGRTTIAIAHRFSTLRIADRLFVVDNGRIVEQGTHDELVIRKGLYAKLVGLQGQTRGGEAGPHGPQPGQQQSDEVRWLDPVSAHVHLGNYRALHVTVLDDRTYSGVYAVRCLPVQHPFRYISLRYIDAEKREREVGLLKDLNDWPPEAQKLVRESLLKRYFVHTIIGINRIESLGAFMRFSVETDLGPIQFVIRSQSDRVHDYGQTGKMILDLDENRYLIPDVQNLPQRDRRLFLRYVYW